MSTPTWTEDILGEGFEALTIDMGPDPEGEGDVIATVVRYVPSISNKKAVLWIPGLSDYVFQRHVAEELGRAFYGIDVRKTGRSRRAGQRWHHTEDLAHYFPDLTAALNVITENHDSVTPIAHSTGGLVASLWLDHLDDVSQIDSLILNSPWLDMMFPRWKVAGMKLLCSTLGRVAPGIKLPDDGLGAYGRSIDNWEFDRTYKPVGGHDKYLGWLGAILRGQSRIHQGLIDVRVPTLCLHSDRSVLGEDFSEKSLHADTVLDVDQIAYWAPRLGSDVTVTKIDGALHDVFLSLDGPRDEAFRVTKQWLH